MENPLEQPLPENEIERVHAFAYDVAWGVLTKRWQSRITVNRHTTWMSERQDDGSYKSVSILNTLPKWVGNFPSFDLLMAFGYFEELEIPVTFGTGQTQTNLAYRLTEKAFALLERPAGDPTVFISYSRRYSTTFALYLESRLRLAGNRAVFVDKSLEPGSQWRDVLEEKIRASRYFIVLCAEGTFDSEWVNKEIELARETGCVIIPILHHNVHNRDLPDVLGDYQTIKVQDRTAAEYETAVNKLLSYMGYATY
ncbi:MAG: toll/interleukin-1 receptor domain-containing protein [Chloroflexota bacterium]